MIYTKLLQHIGMNNYKFNPIDRKQIIMYDILNDLFLSEICGTFSNF